MTTTTKEQRDHADVLRGQVDAAGLRVRIVADGEGFPIIPGRFGQVEYYGADHPTGERRLRVFTNTPRMIRRLLAAPGVHRQQMGAHEARFWFSADSPETLREVCTIIRAKTRRQGGAEHLAQHRFPARRQIVQSAPGSTIGGEGRGR
jgi:hypothetical protein